MKLPREIRRLSVVAALLELGTISSAGSQNGVRYISNPLQVQHDVFVVAHQDDWQLFMGDVVAKQIKTGDSVTFIYLTAGDDGRDSIYWQTRERAALKSTRLAIGTSASNSGALRCARTPVLEHEIQRCVLGNTESYFLRLPDGRRNGAGFVRYNSQSLRKLRGKRIATMSAIDGSATYRGWEDLMAAMSKLIGSSTAGARIVVHTSDPSIAANPHDHFDHRMAGLLVNDLRKRERWNAQYYAGYALSTRAANRSSDQAREKTAIFLAYDNEMVRANKTWSAYAEHPAFYADCMLRTYARKAPSLGRR